MEKLHCYICSSLNTEEEMVCDICGQNYCEDCSYTFSIHYQFQGARCYSCADQRRRVPMSVREMKINSILLYGSNR